MTNPRSAARWSAMHTRDTPEAMHTTQAAVKPKINESESWRECMRAITLPQRQHQH